MEEDYKIYILFNKVSKQMTAFMTDVSQIPEQIRKSLLIKEFKLKDLGFDDDEINLTRFKWEGDYDTGRLIDIVKEKKAIVTEKETNERFHDMFWKRYNIYEVLQELIINTPMITEKGQNMQDFLKKVLQKKEADVKFYQNSPLHIWESEEETVKRQKDAFK
jgi:uncharacterized LabA/DUF88 family protein